MAQFIHIQHQTVSTDPLQGEGGDFIAGALRTRPLNVIVSDDTGGQVTLSSNQITLPEGTYNVFAMAPGAFCGTHQLFWTDVTGGGNVVLLLGSSEVTGIQHLSHAFVGGIIEVVGTRTYELQHQCTITRITLGMGRAMGFGEPNIYADVMLERTA